jgi:hypothetical protein
MELDGRALPLTRGQLDIWLAQETGHSGTEWQLGLGWAIRRAVCVPQLGWEEHPPMALPLEASDEPNRYFIQI